MLFLTDTKKLTRDSYLFAIHFLHSFFIWPRCPQGIINQSYLFIYLFIGPHLQHMEVPRLGVKSELQLPAYTTATATWDPSRICSLHHSSWQCWILNPLSGARNWTLILMDTSWVHYCCATMGTPYFLYYWCSGIWAFSDWGKTVPLGVASSQS